MNHRSRFQLWLPVSLLLALWPALPVTGVSQSPAADADKAPVLGHQEQRSEQFLIEWISDEPHPAEGYRGNRGLERAVLAGEVGLAEFRRHQVDGVWQLEQDVHFPFEEMRLMAVECLSKRSPKLVWRELTRTGGRTVFAEWNAENEQLRVYEWSEDGSLRQTLDRRSRAVMPQYLLELVRGGYVSSGDFEVFDPLVDGFDVWTLELSVLDPGDTDPSGPDPSGPAPDLRQAEFRRSDGSLAGRYRFEGTDLAGFQWQESCLWLRRITEEEYSTREFQWGLAGNPDPEPETVKEM